MFRDGIQRALIGFYNPADRDRKYLAAVIAKEEEVISFVDVWSMALCYLPHERRSLDELMQAGYTLHGAKHVGAEYPGIQLDVESSDKVRDQVRLRESANYMIDRIGAEIPHIANGRSRTTTREFRVTGFREVAPGAFFPTEVVSEHFTDGRPIAVHRATFSDIVINSKSDPSVFEVRFPDNVWVSDHIRDVTYREGANGQPSGPTYKYSPVAGQSGPEMLPPDAPPEESSAVRWLQIGSAVTIVGGLVLMVRHRMRAGRG